MAKIDLSNIGSGVDLSNVGSGVDLSNISSGIDLSNVSPGIEMPQQKGFFGTLRNPIELMVNESLPRQAFNYLSGNTQQVQAQTAKDFIANNPDLEGTPEYKDAQYRLERFGYLLDERPDFSLDMLKQAVKTNPGAMAGEFVNAFMADPYLLFTPYLLGGNALA